MKPRHHVVITGTGRTGSTFLVELLTHLGLDTGYAVSDLAHHKSDAARAGLEHDVRNMDCPYIVKSPFFCDYASSVVSQPNIVIDHVFIPIRDLGAAAESRRYVSNAMAKGSSILRRLLNCRGRRWRKGVAGGLHGTTSSVPGQQESVLLDKIYRLLFVLSDTEVAVTLIRYPRLVKDSQYLYKKLSPVLEDVDAESFRRAFEKAVQPELIHRFGAGDC